MGHQLEALMVKSARPFKMEFNLEPPFSSQIMSEIVSPKFRMPLTKSYDGTTDSLNHLESLKALMLLHRAIDGILCRAFSTTLCKAARL